MSVRTAFLQNGQNAISLMLEIHFCATPGWRHPQSCDAAVPRYSCAFFSVNLLHQPGPKKQHCTSSVSVVHLLLLYVAFIFALSQVSLMYPLTSFHCFSVGSDLRTLHCKSPIVVCYCFV